MLDFGNIGKSAEQMSAAATDMSNNIAGIRLLLIEQNALLAVLTHVAIHDKETLSELEIDTAGMLVNRALRRVEEQE